MKKKQDQDAQGVSELLKKLQASFAAPEKSTPSKKKKNADDVDDLKFQEKLSAMLSKITDPTVKKGKKKQVH